MTKEVIVVSGASRGIGRSIAVGLAKPSTTLILTARSHDELESAAKEIEARGGHAVVSAGDLTDMEFCRQMMADTESKYGPVSVLVNNAGMAIKGPADQINLKQFDKMLDLNVRAVVHLTRLALPGMVAGKGGAIINIASMASRSTGPGMSAYCATKHAVIGFANSVFDDVRDHGIKVASICPGFVATEMTEGANLNQEKMIQPDDILAAVQYILQTSAHCCPFEIQIRPQRSQT